MCSIIGMINKNEIRLGNIITSYDVLIEGLNPIPWVIYPSDMMEMYNKDDWNRYHGIEITKEILLKFKVNFHEGNSDSLWVDYNLDNFVYLNDKDGKFYYVISVEVDDHSCYYFIEKEVKYIHQLQNIHFIWNEEELYISI